jgi:hypothetical protein
LKSRLAVLGVALVLGAAVACSDDGATEREPQPDSPLTTIASTSGTQSPPVVATALVSGGGPGVSVAEAIGSSFDGPLLVNGFLFTKGEVVWLCTSLPREEYPTCGEPSVKVSGLDPATAESVEFLEGIGWTNEPLQVLGSLSDGVLTASGTMLAQ